MDFLAAFFVAILKSELQNSVYRLRWAGVGREGLGPIAGGFLLVLESAKSGFLANLVSSLYRNGKTWCILHVGIIKV